MFTPKFFLQIAAIFALISVQGYSLTFKESNQVVRELDRSEIEAIYEPSEVEVFDPIAGQEVKYRGWNISKFLDAVLARKFTKWRTWRSYDELQFESRLDRQVLRIPISLILERKPYIVFERSSNVEFRMMKSKGNFEEYALGPFYLVWDELHSQKQSRVPEKFWLPQVTAIQLVDYPVAYKFSGPYKAAQPQAKMGFHLFRENCMQCHAMNGEGNGRELNFPVNVTEYFDKNKLAQYILKPQSVRWNAQMPPYVPIFGDANDEVKSIIRYLESMAQRKKQPSTKITPVPKDLMSHH